MVILILFDKTSAINNTMYHVHILETSLVSRPVLNLCIICVSTFQVLLQT